MKLIPKSSVALVGVLFLAAPSADAATVFLQAGSGHLFLSSGTVNWETTWSTPGLRFEDGRSVFVPAPGGGNTIRTWVIPIPITGTNQNWNALARGSGAAISHRICSFTSNGTFSNCGAQVSFGQTSTVLVPTDGTAFSQTTLTATSPNDSGKLVSVRANN